MDYTKWGQEYLIEAKKIKAHIDNIRLNWKHKSQDEKLSINHRTAILYDMYLECKHTGELLLQRGNKNEN
ncbi:hypothetical protein [Scatolibacter rhodanostii]|uniref:hypothetical protein n=1 Tax=Scatolibacter rhodanostii TaxID=2014781 RepID=UPI000C083B1D|nr:hypothetical protein [Scatolibacter rhodanostii]